MREHENGAREGRGAEPICAIVAAALLIGCMMPQQQGNDPRACGSFLAFQAKGHSRRDVWRVRRR